ncbi:MAG: HAMP domain-containing histidine kinase [Deltaproteobacteria bacterium]|nr:HAMP domain-containing histidine kinase [Deltaproteobacteria bacterium]
MAHDHVEPPRSLRGLVFAATVIVAVLAVLAAGALITATNLLQRTAKRSAASVESVRFFEEAEIHLLLLARTDDPVVKRNLEGDLITSLEAAGVHVTSAAEARALRDAHASLEKYRAVTSDPATSHAAVEQAESRAFAALDALVDINVEQTRRDNASAAVLTNVANVVGAGIAIAIIGLATFLLLWSRHHLLRPLFALADTMRRFAGGDRGVRARDHGPLELREMSSRFNAMAESIATQREAQSAFLGGIAHDLRTPLSALRTAVDVLEMDEHPPRSRQVLGVLTRQIERLERMTGDFLDISKIEAGKLELHLAPHDLRAIGRGVVELFAGERRRVELDVPGEPVRVVCDDVRINQVLTNLVSNALKFSPPTEAVRVAIRAREGGAVVEVADRGTGIAREDLDRIFEPFRRTAATHGVPGTGLGLVNVKRLVEAHGGRIEIDSAPARGSVFRVILPA